MGLGMGKVAFADFMGDPVVLPLRAVQHLVAARVAMLEAAIAGKTGGSDQHGGETQQQDAGGTGGTNAWRFSWQSGAGCAR